MKELANKVFCIRVKTPRGIDPKDHLIEVITTGIDLASFKDSEIDFVDCRKMKK